MSLIKEEIPIATEKSQPSAPESQEEWDSFLESLNTLCAEESEQEPKVQEKPAKKKKRRSRLPVILLAVVLILALAGGAVYWLLPQMQALSDPYGGKMLSGVSAAGIDLGGMTKSQAAKAIEAVYGKLNKNDLVISLPDTALRLSPKNSGIALDIDRMVEDAYSCGRTDGGAVGDITDYLHINEAAIRKAVNDYGAGFSALYTPVSCTLEGEIPALDEASFNESAPCPTLLLTTGTPGFELDADAICSRILSALLEGKTDVDATDQLTEKAAEQVDLAKVLEEAGVAPVNARLENGKAVPGSYGLGFDEEEAQKILAKAAPGETVRIPMTYTAPEVIGQEVYFQDILGFCQTPHSTNEKRTTNLQLACAALNGVVLQPGETLSYNATLGKRTEEAGYLPAPAYSGKVLVDSIGGGICQVSSTLYLCSLYAEMETVDRVSHGYPVAYIPIGLDATVSWGKPDLKIKNPTDLPVKIIAEECDGFVRVWLMGTDTRDYYIRMGYSSSKDGYAKNYINKYSKETDEQISSEGNHLSSYMSKIDSLRGEIGPNQAYINGMAREQDPCEPTPETLAASRRNIAPNAHADQE